MSLTELSLIEVVKRQYQYKLKAYIGVFSSMIIAQIIAALFSIGGNGQAGTGSSTGMINMYFYTSDMIIIFTFIWAFVIAISLTSKGYKQDDFVFVTNRMGSNLSNIAFLGTASVIAATTAIMASFLLKVSVYLFFPYDFVTGSIHSLTDLLIGIFSTSLYLFFVMAFGYLIGVVSRRNTLFAILIPACLIGFVFLDVRLHGAANMVFKFVGFYGGETAMIMFILKTLGTSALLYYGAVVLSNRMEVRQ